MFEIAPKIYWNGVKDWGLKVFHGHELSTQRGSTYNSYIIKDQKTVLVDTVWDPFKEEFIERLEREIGLENIDMVVINHNEPDHGGSLGLLMGKIPNVPIYCTKNGSEIIKKHFHKDWNFNIVKTGDSINIGEYDLLFVDMQMIHWPDSMMTYVKGPGVLLSNDAFGQHYCTSDFYNDQVDQYELFHEAFKYYACIVSPFNAHVKRKVEFIKTLDLDIKIIAPSHGVIWRKNPGQIIDLYYKWCQDYKEDLVLVIYETMYNSTRIIAEAIGKGLEQSGVKYRIYNAAVSDKSDLLTEVFKAKGVLFGSCTVDNTMLSALATVIEEVKAHKISKKIGAGFGSYGWSGEAPKIINRMLGEMGWETPLNILNIKYRPTVEEIKQCEEFGRKFAEYVR